METWVVLQAYQNQESASCTVRLWVRSPSVAGKWVVSWVSSRPASKGIPKMRAQSTLGSWKSLKAFAGTNWLERVSGTASNEEEKSPLKARRVWAPKTSRGFQEPTAFSEKKTTELELWIHSRPQAMDKGRVSLKSKPSKPGRSGREQEGSYKTEAQLLDECQSGIIK